MKISWNFRCWIDINISPKLIKTKWMNEWLHVYDNVFAYQPTDWHFVNSSSHLSLMNKNNRVKYAYQGKKTNWKWIRFMVQTEGSKSRFSFWTHHRMTNPSWSASLTHILEATWSYLLNEFLHKKRFDFANSTDVIDNCSISSIKLHVCRS